MKKLILSAILGLLFIGAANAIAPCAICTVGVGAGLEAARVLGVDDTITGIWSGALMLLLYFWTIKWYNNRNWKNGWLWFGTFVLYFGFLGGVYLLPGIDYGTHMMWGLDKFTLGIIVGTIVMWIAEIRLSKSIAKNGGKARYKFQKVIEPVSALIILSVIFYLVVKG